MVRGGRGPPRGRFRAIGRRSAVIGRPRPVSGALICAGFRRLPELVAYHPKQLHPHPRKQGPRQEIEWPSGFGSGRPHPIPLKVSFEETVSSRQFFDGGLVKEGITPGRKTLGGVRQLKQGLLMVQPRATQVGADSRNDSFPWGRSGPVVGQAGGLARSALPVRSTNITRALGHFRQPSCSSELSLSLAWSSNPAHHAGQR